MKLCRALAVISLATCINFTPLFANSKNQELQENQNIPAWQKDVNELDQKIEVLQKWQSGYRSTADQAQFKADRLQFQQDDFMDSKRLWKIAESANQKAEDLQVIINQLVDKRNAILRQHNQPIPNGSGRRNKS